MRYIRTKTFITDLASWMEVDDKTLIIGGVKHEIVAQSDTIEELCDEFVIEDNGHCISDLYTIKRLLVKNKAVVYGAIWTDKGLIYVAKMNDKGELELL